MERIKKYLAGKVYIKTNKECKIKIKVNNETLNYKRIDITNANIPIEDLIADIVESVMEDKKVVIEIEIS